MRIAGPRMSAPSVRAALCKQTCDCRGRNNSHLSVLGCSEYIAESRKSLCERPPNFAISTLRKCEKPECCLRDKNLLSEHSQIFCP
jgi:hypothetical protein